MSLALVLSGLLSAEAATIEGQIFDRQGRPLSGIEVQVIQQTGGSFIPGIDVAVTTTPYASARSDRHGFFSVDLGGSEPRGRLLVDCHDEGRWDAIRYAPPEPIDVTESLSTKGRAIVSCVVEDAPAWREVAAEIERAGGARTPRGRILRTHGLPPETMSQSDGTVLWRYAFVTYVFRDGELVETIEATRQERSNRPRGAS